MTDLESQYLQRDALALELRAAHERKDKHAVENLTAALERSHEQIARLLVNNGTISDRRGFRQWLHRVRHLYRDLRRIAQARGVPPLTYREFIQKFLD